MTFVSKLRSLLITFRFVPERWKTQDESKINLGTVENIRQIYYPDLFLAR